MSAGGEITCTEVVELVTEYLEGALDRAAAARFEGHLDECDGCRVYVEQLRETVVALGYLPAESLTDEARESLIAAFAGWRDHPD